MVKARAAALSSAGLMLIAGCSGGGHGGGSALPGTPLATSSAIALANAAKVTLSINIPPRQTQSFRRGQKFVPTAATRKPSYVSPSTYYVSLNAVSGGTSIYSTYFTVAQCAPYGSVYECATNLPYGTFTLYTNLYDQQGYMLSTNMYSNPAPVTVYPNGSTHSNYLYVQTAGVINNLQTLAPSGCFAAGHQQSIPLYVLDADGNTIVGPVANPITPTFTAVNGGGLAAINIYAIYNGSPVSINNVAVSDTSLYSSPYFFVNGSEGAINIAATFQNMPVYSNGAYTYTPSAGYAATGTYIAWAIDASAYNIYTIAIEQSINQAITCGGGVNGTYQQWTYIGSIKDSGNGNPYIVVSDFNNNVDIFDAYSVADYTRSYMFFQTSSAYGNPGPHAALYQTMDYVPSQPFVDFFTSANVTGRINVLSSNGSTGQIALIDTSNGAQSALHGPFTTAFPLYGATRVTGTQLFNSLYYDVVNTTWLYGVNTSTSTAFTPIDFSTSTAITGQIYSMSPSGNAHSYQFVRGADTSGNFHICAFDANPANFGLGIFCANTSSHNANIASMQFDPGSGALMWSGGFSGSTSTVYALNAYAQPSTFAAGPFTGAPHYTLSSATFRFVPGLEAVPSVVGLYGGPQTSGPCTGTGEVTWLSYSGGAFTYIASVCWPTHYITLTYQ